MKTFSLVILLLLSIISSTTWGQVISGGGGREISISTMRDIDSVIKSAQENWKKIRPREEIVSLKEIYLKLNDLELIEAISNSKHHHGCESLSKSASALEALLPEKEISKLNGLLFNPEFKIYLIGRETLNEREAEQMIEFFGLKLREIGKHRETHFGRPIPKK